MTQIKDIYELQLIGTAVTYLLVLHQLTVS